MADSLGSALYYPYIHVRDASWLKMALLYWESVVRIVPENYAPHDSTETQPAVKEGLIRRVSPKPYLQKTANRFRREFLNPKQKQKQRRVWQTIDTVPTERRVDLHVGKLEDALLHELMQRRLAGLSAEDGDIDVHKEVGLAYMLALATEMSNDLGLPVVTHESGAADALPLFNFKIPKFPLGRFAGIPTIVRLNIPFPTATAVAEIPWKKLLKFRRDEQALREDFRASLEEIAAAIPREGDPDYIRSEIDLQRQKIANLVARQTGVFERLSVKTAVAALQLTIPTSVKTAATAAGLAPLGGTIAAGAAAIVVGFAIWAAHSMEQESLKSRTPFQYLIDVHKLADEPLAFG